MRKTPILTLCTSLLALPFAHGATVIVGDDADQAPGPSANLDGATPMIIVDYQANLYTNTTGNPEVLIPSVFNFYAAGAGPNNIAIGHVRPFVALLNGAGTLNTDYDVVAIGSNRIEGVDFADGGLISLPFGGTTPTITVPAGGVLVGGIEHGTSGAGSNVVPFASDSGFNTFITGGGPGGSIDVATDITPGPSTWTSLNGGRNYEFTIEVDTIPEPSTTTLLPVVLGGLLLLRRRR